MLGAPKENGANCFAPSQAEPLIAVDELATYFSSSTIITREIVSPPACLTTTVT